MKVLHISGARSWGGNEQQLIDLISELELLNVASVVFGVKNSPLESECGRHNIKFLTSDQKKLNKFSNYKLIKKIVKQELPDVIHLHTSDSLTVFTLSDILYSLKTPTVFSKKGMGNSSSVLSKLKYNYKNISAVICVSKKVKNEFSQILSPKNHRKLEVIYDGISVSRIKEPNYKLKDFLKIEQSKFIIGNIANHVKAKDLPTLILAMNELINIKNIRNVHLIQLGSINPKITPEITALIEQYQLQNNISLVGFLENASSFISEFELYVMSSEREGFPLTIYESFYKKTPVVSTAAGGIPEILIDGENGFLTEVKDYKSLAEKINQLIFNEDLKNKFAQKAYDLFTKNYTTQHCALKTLNLYKRISK
ncbi:glycosyltransferase [Flavobacterium sp. NST-5]|uniref:Glycosyltransferase n=1 Tax=Flavobacterium ichthyis TaxID=2698827 RepID=A0ABW9Z8R9_9FLAO|nr:glycosyltransferase family 4 protein [Flavobacterium ichthyis]NBL65273.1 glycosyltransferase [Flavobacterium ichthyis]